MTIMMVVIAIVGELPTKSVVIRRVPGEGCVEGHSDAHVLVNGKPHVVAQRHLTIALHAACIVRGGACILCERGSAAYLHGHSKVLLTLTIVLKSFLLELGSSLSLGRSL